MSTTQAQGADEVLPAMPKTTELAAYVRKLEQRLDIDIEVIGDALKNVVAHFEERVAALEARTPAAKSLTARLPSPDYCQQCGSKLPFHFDHCDHYVPRTREARRDG